CARVIGVIIIYFDYW
nr:immunoglobulin heavy chain junction region [Macaca mulatta]MOX38301.1 immunoglobulin heavy chain junction region [Macaca mulatta]MOX39175.1 immunoglobulin heavy chain junction region [Macaca mulatta]